MANRRTLLAAFILTLSMGIPRPAGPAFSIPEIAWDSRDSSIAVVDDGGLEYVLPFTFPFFGRGITKIQVNTNGLIELLEPGESCAECDDYNTHSDGDHATLNIDAIFAANDDLITGVIVEGFSDRVEIAWSGKTLSDSSFEFDPLAYKVILFSDGRVQWKFFDMDYSSRDGDLFSGVYDEIADQEIEIPGGSTSFSGTSVNRAFELDPSTTTISTLSWDPTDTNISASDDRSTEYDLPFTFPYFGRSIVRVSVSTNGLIELLEAGESCRACSATSTHSSGNHVTSDIDAIFAANDDLRASVIIEGSSQLVEIIWFGTTFQDADYDDRQIAFKVMLLANGTIRWKFFDMVYVNFSSDLFSGMYDEIDDAEFEVSGGSTAFTGTEVNKAFEFVGTPPTTTTTTTSTTTTLPPRDHFLCYKAKPSKGTPKLQQVPSLDLADQFEDKKFNVLKPVALCNPADKNGEGIIDPEGHLEDYQIKRGKTCSDDGNPCTGNNDCSEGASCEKLPKHARQARILVTNQIGQIIVDTVKPLTLLVPTAKDLAAPPPPPNRATSGLDHFKCYKIKLHKKLCLGNRTIPCKADSDCQGAGPCFRGFPKGIQASLEDQFTQSPVLFNLKKPTRLCLPADKNHEGIKNPVTHLLCYRIKRVKGRCAQGAPENAGKACKKEADCGGEKRITSLCIRQPKHEKLIGIHVNNQFGQGQLDALKEVELCVPSSKETALAPPTPTPTAQPTPPASPSLPPTTTSTTSTTTTTSTTATTLPAGPPPDPADVAPPIDESIATDVATAAEFLYSGPDMIQRGVTPATIDPKRVAVIRGLVVARDGTPIPEVMVSILDHPEFGHTLTRVDGMFDMAVNGGEPLTIDYSEANHLPAQRTVEVRWQGFVWAPEVVLIERDPQATPITLGAAAPMQVAQGSPQSDSDGTRQATLLFPAGTTAVMTLAGGATQQLTNVTVRATEYTVGSNGPNAMPGELPPTSAYTYAVELSIDEAEAAGAVDVRFNQPVIFYLDNFLGFEAGEVVPAGFYDRLIAAWVSSESGRVVAILAETGGLADLDTDGDGVADDSATLGLLGISGDERQTLATLYDPGQSLWRVPIDHFTPWDCNWPVSPPAGADFPNQPSPRSPNGPSRRPPSDDPCQKSGSIIECQNQVLGQRLPLTGTPFTLNYRSDRVRGRSAAFTAEIPLSGPNVPTSLKRIDLTVTVAGQRQEFHFPPNANRSFSFIWNGRDAYGRLVQGRQMLVADIGYVYDAVYGRTDRFANVSDGSITGSRARSEITLRQIVRAFVGAWTALGQGLGAWTIDVHHAYDPTSGILYLGNGKHRGAQQVRAVGLTTAAGGGTILGGDGVPATDARLFNTQGVVAGADGSFYTADFTRGTIHRITPDGMIARIAGNFRSPNPNDGALARNVNIASPLGLAVGPDGSVYYAENNRHHIWRILPDGTIRNFAGTGFFTGTTSGRFAGDGGVATDANLNRPAGLALAPDGTLYIADSNNHRIRRVGTDGIISTVAGGGSGGDGGAATAARLAFPRDVALGPEGSLYIADTSNNRIRRVGADGIITTVAGTGVAGFSGDGGPATSASLNNPSGVFVTADGTIYIGDRDNHRVRKVNPNGIITTFAGSGPTFGSPDFSSGGFGGDGGPPAAARFSFPAHVAVGPDNTVYIGDASNNRVRRVTSAMPGFSGGDLAVASDDGTAIYQFSPAGRHLRTISTLTGATLFEFSYDAAGRLLGIRDGSGNSTTVERDLSGNATAIVAPNGQRTALAMDGQGYLTRLTNPAGEATQFTYTPAGLMLTMQDPGGHAHQFSYDSLGRFTREDNPAGGFLAFGRSDLPDGSVVTLTTTEGQVKIYRTEILSDDTERRVTGESGGPTAVVERRPDGTVVNSFADGSESSLLFGPDPRFGMQAPVAELSSITTPGGLSSVVTMQRDVVLAQPGNPLSLQALTETTDNNGRVFETTFNTSSRALTRRSPLGREVTSTLDPMGRVTNVQLPGLAELILTYDASGRVTGVTQDGGSEARTSSLTYNSLGQVAAITDTLGQTVHFSYDAAGRMISLERPDGEQLRFSYDTDGNLTAITPPGRPAHAFSHTPVHLRRAYTAPDLGAGSTPTQFAYNGDKQLSSITQPDGQVMELSYTTSGHLARTTAMPAGAMTDYGYDAASGQLRTIVAPGGEVLTYTYDGPLLVAVEWSGPVAGTVSSTFSDGFQLAGRSVNGGNNVSFGYDGDGLLTQAGALALRRDAANGLVTGTTIDQINTTVTHSAFAEVGGLTVEVTSTTPPTAVYDVSYTRDALGRVSEKTETVAGTTTIFGFSYDLAGRLSDVTRGGVNIAHYEHDSNGNRLSRTTPTGATSATYDDQDRLLTYGAATYSYTAGGFLESRDASGSVTTYGYDGVGNLTAVTLPDGTSIEYITDGMNRRVGKLVNGGMVQGFLYKDHLSPVAELDGTGAVVSRFTYATHSNVPDYMIRGGASYFIISDQIGSPRVVIDTSTGAIVQEIVYDEFGNVILDTNPGFQPFGFAGGIYDRDTGLVHFGAREYDPQTGRWISRDPILFSGGDTNLYGYVLNDPVNLVDPSGKFLPQLIGGAVGFAAGVIQADINGEGASGTLRAGLIGAATGVLSTLPIPGLGPLASSIAAGALAGGLNRGANTFVSTGCLPSLSEVAVSAGFGGFGGALGFRLAGGLNSFSSGAPQLLANTINAAGGGLAGANLDAFTDDVVAQINGPAFQELGPSPLPPGGF